MYNLTTSIERLRKNHLSFIETYPEDIKTDTGRTYCINNLLRESASLITDLSHHLIVEKDLTSEQSQDYFTVVLTETLQLMDKHNGRDAAWYINKIEEMSKELDKTIGG